MKDQDATNIVIKEVKNPYVAQLEVMNEAMKILTEAIKDNSSIQNEILFFMEKSKKEQ